MSALYVARVMHTRPGKPAYRFVYRIGCLLLDIDRLHELDARLRWFSVDRWNLFSLRLHDHLPAGHKHPRTWVEQVLSAHGIRLDGGSIHLLCMPRLLGYGFDPLAVWYCYGPDGELRALLCEVRNTFGEKHHYLLPCACGVDGWSTTFEANKVFHVSPFLALTGAYRFNFKRTGQALSVRIEYRVDAETRLLATLTGRRQVLDDRALLRLFSRQPLMSLKVIAMIHWQALKLWVRGARFHRKPPAPSTEVTLAWVHRPDSNS